MTAWQYRNTGVIMVHEYDTNYIVSVLNICGSRQMEQWNGMVE